MGGAELVERAVAGTARVVEAARAGGVPVFQTVAFRGGAENGWDVHRRYAEVTTADDVVDYLAGVTAGVAA